MICILQFADTIFFVPIRYLLLGHETDSKFSFCEKIVALLIIKSQLFLFSNRYNLFGQFGILFEHSKKHFVFVLKTVLVKIFVLNL